MQLCDKDIYESISKGELMFVTSNPRHPFDVNNQIQPASVDLRLGPRIRRFNHDISCFDLKDLYAANDRLYQEECIEEGTPISINPGETIIGSIYELIAIPNNMSARVRGRNRVSRLGISVHCTGDYINPGFQGEMPLQITNHGPFSVKLYPYFELCQMVLYRLTQEPLVSYEERKKLLRASYFEGDLSEFDGDQKVVEVKIRRMISEYSEELRRANGKGQSFVDKEKILISQNLGTVEDAKKTTNTYLVINKKEGDLIMSNVGDTYYTNQAGVVGKHAAEGAIITTKQVSGKGLPSDSDLEKMMNDLSAVKQYLREHLDEDDNAIALGDVTSASQSISNGKPKEAEGFLRKSGKVILDVATEVGSGILQAYLCGVLGLKQ